MKSCAFRVLPLICFVLSAQAQDPVATARKALDLMLGEKYADLEPLFTCQVCGERGADVRPNFSWEEEARRATTPGRHTSSHDDTGHP